MQILLLVAGLALLVAGAEILVRGASRLAAAIGISPLVIGLTVVAFGTSAPELAVSLGASVTGQGDIAVGNVVGSNIFNVLLILGLSAVITPLFVSLQLVRLDVPIMIGVSGLALLLGLDGKIGRMDGTILFAGVLLYTGFLIRQSRKETREALHASVEENDQENEELKSWFLNVSLIIGGLGLLALGSRWLIKGAVYIAQYFEVSELIIGLTIVAAGTSLPEVATSVIASIRGERDIAVGNVVGSNIFNIMAVLGLCGIVAPAGIQVSSAALRFDMPVMIAAAVACLPIFATGRVIARWEGALFLFYYVAYTLYLILAAAQHDAVSALRVAMIWFIIPLTVLTLAVVSVRTSLGRKKRDL